MKDLFDVHCHMVPGVDDGASDLEESLAMLKMEYRDGVRNIIVTPHYRRRMFETQADRKSTRLNSSHNNQSRMPSSA